MVFPQLSVLPKNLSPAAYKLYMIYAGRRLKAVVIIAMFC